MSALINALDNRTVKQLGENGHVEYGWSNGIRERIVQFSFQCTRTDDTGLKNLKEVLNDLLDFLKKQQENKSSSLILQEEAKGYLSMLYRMIGYTRDIVDGKGEYALTYMMLHTWYDYFPELSLFALKCLVDLGDRKVHQYGSWKDIKYFCDYCTKNGCTVDHPLIQYSIELTNEQLKKDHSLFVSGSKDISLVAKWIPREKSSYNWLYHSLATNYFSEICTTAKPNTPSYSKAVLKCKTDYRKILSTLNKYIDTLQIKQCGRNWKSINFDKVTSISITKQKKAFLNIKANGEMRYDDEDRITCSENFKTRIAKAVSGEVEMKGKRVSMTDFTKQALDLIGRSNEDEINLLNSQWRDNSTQNSALGNFIAMVDVSGSMNGDPMYAAIALGIRIAEKSVLGKRVMTFSARPEWVNLTHCNDFVSQVQTVSKANWGANTNFKAAMQMILDSIVEAKMEPEDVQNMVLVILSDMQMDEADICDKTALYESINASYSLAGMRVHGKPYKPPHILFWNLRSTSGFPTLTNQQNVSMMSGFSPVLLNLFCEKGIEALESCTPWSILEQSLNSERYNILRVKFDEFC
uniref:VWFA domain-containing protein n=1 Tax=viral metagenome TaxID=1070528 RepID=A0A6C0EQ78_9ZZZZ